ncbi:DMT family transporter [Pyrobaculum sp.]|uniref:DMT family transporter n=1 Tax=Pyrobaculum sp. TaxID=2004705 RepID=UPI00317B0FB4
MDLLGVAAALAAATIWALVIFLYKKHMEGLDAVVVNFSRLFYVAVFMWPVVFMARPSEGLIAAVASGLLTLVVGDSLYFYAIHKVGGSVAAPLVYSYVVIAQYFAFVLGEAVSPFLILASVLVVAGVSLLARGGGPARVDVVGVFSALAAALMWSLGMTAIKVASVGGVHPAVIAYTRVLSALVALGAYLYIRRRVGVVKSYVFAAASVLDLGVGSSLFAYAVEKAGLSLATILVATSPLITQLYARAAGLEKLTPLQAVGAVAIFAAVAVAVGLR